MLFELEIRMELAPRNNIAPTQQILAVRLNQTDQEREAVLLRWGLVPYWSKDKTIGSKMINARSETARQKPSFRDAFLRRRVLIPVSGFYEWKKEEGGKQPYLIGMNGGHPLALAGLWESWGRGGEYLETCTILTTSPNSLISPIHNRMPVIISTEGYRDWLDPETTQQKIASMLEPFPAEMMSARPVQPTLFK